MASQKKAGGRCAMELAVTIVQRSPNNSTDKPHTIGNNEVLGLGGLSNWPWYFWEEQECLRERSRDILEGFGIGVHRGSVRDCTRDYYEKRRWLSTRSCAFTTSATA